MIKRCFSLCKDTTKTRTDQKSLKFPHRAAHPSASGKKKAHRRPVMSRRGWACHVDQATGLMMNQNWRAAVSVTSLRVGCPWMLLASRSTVAPAFMAVTTSWMRSAA